MYTQFFIPNIIVERITIQTNKRFSLRNFTEVDSLFCTRFRRKIDMFRYNFRCNTFICIGGKFSSLLLMHRAGNGTFLLTNACTYQPFTLVKTTHLLFYHTRNYLVLHSSCTLLSYFSRRNLVSNRNSIYFGWTFQLIHYNHKVKLMRKWIELVFLHDLQPKKWFHFKNAEL